MSKATYAGRCAYCDGEFPKGRMTAHLKACKQKPPVPETGTGTGKALQIAIEGRYIPDYWLQVEASPDALFDELDHFLRDIWLECCGHLSAFNVGTKSYESTYRDFLDVGFAGESESFRGVQMASVLEPKTRFTYEYDFGSTTALNLRVISVRESWNSEPGVHLLARNVQPDIRCGECGKPAEFVCPFCAWSEGGWFCAECAEDHDCGMDLILPVVNSPRTGVCAYDGGVEFW